ncbi:hypothetical protein K470DRAFT_270451 [Piedraia hortae CBS 480.64]|uniref:Uncharacterized protein n=1 Tax=Piedraia hortae CBS 480.64 TaxID=1314780 RepID=A0A6A7C0J8_9PEZI|nr:hypothetical protein K470DRAFT_270451 [Piedraia hortae CBS 480.64]
MTFPPMIVSGDRYSTVKPVCNYLFRTRPHVFSDLLPWDMPQKASRREEEDFIRKFFDEEFIHTQGGAFGDGEGFRFLKQVLWSIAIYNIEQRVPAIANEWLSNNFYIWVDPANIPDLMRSDVAPMTFFHEKQVAMYGEKLLRWVIFHIQYNIQFHAAMSGIPCAPISPMGVDNKGFPTPLQMPINHQKTPPPQVSEQPYQMPPADPEALQQRPEPGTIQPDNATSAPQTEENDSANPTEPAAGDQDGVQSTQAHHQIEQSVAPNLPTISEQSTQQTHETDPQVVGQAHSQGAGPVRSHTSGQFHPQVIQNANFQPQGHANSQAYPQTWGHVGQPGHVPSYGHYVPPHGQPHGPSHGPPHPQHYTLPYGQQYVSPQGPPQGQTYGLQGQAYMQSGPQMYGQMYGQSYPNYGQAPWQPNEYNPQVYAPSDPQPVWVQTNTRAPSNQQEKPRNRQGDRKKRSTTENANRSKQPSPPAAQKGPSSVLKESSPERQKHSAPAHEEQSLTQQAPPPYTQQEPAKPDIGLPPPIVSSSEEDSHTVKVRIPSGDQYPPSRKVTPLPSDKAGPFQPTIAAQGKSSTIQPGSKKDTSLTASPVNGGMPQPPAAPVAYTRTGPSEAKARDSQPIDKGKARAESRATTVHPPKSKGDQSPANLDYRVDATYIGEGATEAVELFLFRMAKRLSSAEALTLLQNTFSGVEKVSLLTLSQRLTVHQVIMRSNLYAKRLLEENSALPHNRQFAIEVPHKYHTGPTKPWDYAGSWRKFKKAPSHGSDNKLDITKPWDSGKAKAQGNDHTQWPTNDYPPASKDTKSEVAEKAPDRPTQRTFANAVANGRDSSAATNVQPAAKVSKGADRTVAAKGQSAAKDKVPGDKNSQYQASMAEAKQIKATSSDTTGPAATRGIGVAKDSDAPKVALPRTREPVQPVAKDSKEIAGKMAKGADDADKGRVISTDTVEAHDMAKDDDDNESFVTARQASGRGLAEPEEKPSGASNPIGITRTKSDLEPGKIENTATRTDALPPENLEDATSDIVKAQQKEKEKGPAQTESHQPIFSRKRKKEKYRRDNNDSEKVAGALVDTMLKDAEQTSVKGVDETSSKSVKEDKAMAEQGKGVSDKKMDNAPNVAKPKDDKHDDIKSRDVETENVKTDNAKAKDVEGKGAKTDDVKAKEVEAGVVDHDVKAGDVKTKDAKAESPIGASVIETEDKSAKTDTVKDSADIDVTGAAQSTKSAKKKKKSAAQPMPHADAQTSTGESTAMPAKPIEPTPAPTGSSEAAGSVADSEDTLVADGPMNSNADPSTVPMMVSAAPPAPMQAVTQGQSGSNGTVKTKKVKKASGRQKREREMRRLREASMANENWTSLFDETEDKRPCLMKNQTVDARTMTESAAGETRENVASIFFFSGFAPPEGHDSIQKYL